MDDPDGAPRFAETQRFPRWITLSMLVPVVALVAIAVVMWSAGPDGRGPAAVVGVVAVVLAALAGPSLGATLVTTVDRAGLHLRVRPRGLPLPRRLTDKDVGLDEIVRLGPQRYNAVTDTEYWGVHLWGLGVGRGGRYLYVMRPDSPITGSGLQLDLRSGDRLLIGSARPEALSAALAGSVDT